MDAAVMTVLSELDDIFTLEEEQRGFCFTPDWLRRIVARRQMMMHINCRPLHQ